MEQADGYFLNFIGNICECVKNNDAGNVGLDIFCHAHQVERCFNIFQTINFHRFIFLWVP